MRYVPEHDALTDDKLPMIRRSGGTVVDLVKGTREPSLADIRNSSAHGYLSFPKIRSGPDSRCEGESEHHPMRCLRLST
jgi:hypothetical protein